jgi:hypothetical protein
LRRQSNQRPGSCLTASFSSSWTGKLKTISRSRGLSARRKTRPETRAELLWIESGTTD